MKLLLFFVDGLGLGSDDNKNPARNLFKDITGLSFVEDSAPGEFDAGLLLAADACGGVKGRPQSATGQASLMTGVNGPALLGYHLTALPNKVLVDLVEEKSLMRSLSESGLTVTASNLYTPEYFKRREDLASKRGHNTLPVSALTIRASGAPFRMPKEYDEGRALFTDLTNRFLRDKGYDIPLIEPEEAAHRMGRILEEADFVFHEYFATDTYAHKSRHEDLDRALAEIDLFITTLRKQTDPGEVAILIVSDHGNCEDRNSADHNRNPVPVLLLTENELARDVFRGVSSLQDIKYAVEAFFHLPPEDLPPMSDTDWS